MISKGTCCCLLPHSWIPTSRNCLRKVRYLNQRNSSERGLWSRRSPFKFQVRFIFSYLDTTTSCFRTYFVLPFGISAPLSSTLGSPQRHSAAFNDRSPPSIRVVAAEACQPVSFSRTKVYFQVGLRSRPLQSPQPL